MRIINNMTDAKNYKISQYYTNLGTRTIFE